uniref:AP2/ERF domain-containing protein n=1 Tax=Caenorhabditis tropicalis TaxID=1561998 RepID=A0A1I7SZG2_9PELO
MVKMRADMILDACICELSKEEENQQMTQKEKKCVNAYEGMMDNDLGEKDHKSKFAYDEVRSATPTSPYLSKQVNLSASLGRLTTLNGGRKNHSSSGWEKRRATIKKGGSRKDWKLYFKTAPTKHVGRFMTPLVSVAVRRKRREEGGGEGAQWSTVEKREEIVCELGAH